MHDLVIHLHMLDVGPVHASIHSRLVVPDVHAGQGHARHGQWDGVWLGDAVEGSEVHALDAKHKQDDVSDVHLGAVDLDGDSE